MKNILLLVCLLLATQACAGTQAKVYTKKEIKSISALVEKELETGDVVFQYTNTRVAAVTESVTDSPVTHAGIVIKRGKNLMILEAGRKVKFTSVKNFIRKSKNGWFAVQRPVKKLTPEQKAKLIKNSKKWLGKPYDIRFAWDSKKIYCTELVYKMYKEIGIEISDLETKGDILYRDSGYSWQLALYIKKVYGDKSKINKKEKILTPVKLLFSDKMNIVYSSSLGALDTFPYYEQMK